MISLPKTQHNFWSSVAKSTFLSTSEPSGHSPPKQNHFTAIENNYFCIIDGFVPSFHVFLPVSYTKPISACFYITYMLTEMCKNYKLQAKLHQPISSQRYLAEEACCGSHLVNPRRQVLLLCPHLMEELLPPQNGSV